VFCSRAEQCRISVCYILEIQETELRKLDKSGMCVRSTSILLLYFFIPSFSLITFLLCFLSLLYFYHFFIFTPLFLLDNCIRLKYSIMQCFLYSLLLPPFNTHLLQFYYTATPLLFLRSTANFFLTSLLLHLQNQNTVRSTHIVDEREGSDLIRSEYDGKLTQVLMTHFSFLFLSILVFSSLLSLTCLFVL
jgi:hypothetical protein